MAENWWENDPIVEETPPTSEENWWGNDPIDPSSEEEFGPQAAETGRVSNLPVPTQDMFADMDDEDAKSVYDAYARHPDTKIDQKTGDVIYRDTPVPRPEGNAGFIQSMTDAAATTGAAIFGGYSPVTKGIDYLFGTDIAGGIQDTAGDVSRGITGGGYNAAKNVVVGGTALAEALPMPGAELSETVGGKGLAATLDESIPEFNPEGGLQHAAAIGSEIGTGIVLGNKALAALKAKGVAGPVLQSLKNKVPTAIKYLSSKFVSAVASGAGTAATVDGANDTLIIGRNPEWESLQKSFPILKGLQDADPDTAARILEDRLNVLFDGMLIAAPVELLADGGKGLIRLGYQKFLKPIEGTLSEGKRSQQIMDSLFESVAEAVDPKGANPEKAEFWKNKIVEILQDPDNSKVIFGVDKKGMKGVDVTLDTAATVRRGIESIDPKKYPHYRPEDAEAVKRLFTETSKGLADTGSRTAIATDRAAMEADRISAQASDAFGGEAAIDQSREGLQNIGERKVRDAIRGDPTSAAQKQLSAQSDQFVSEVSGQSDLGTGLVEAKDEGFSDTFVKRNQLTKEILEAEETGSKKVKGEAESLLNAISDKAQPRKTLEESLSKAVEGVDYLTPEMKTILKESGTGLDEEADEFVVGNFKMLQRLRGPLKDEIQRLRAEKSPGADILQNVLDDISNVKGNTGKGELKKFIEYDERSAAPLTRQGLPKELDKTRQALYNDPPKKAEATANLLRSTLTSSEPDVVSHLTDVLSDERYGKVHDKIAQYAFADVVDSVRQQIRESPLSEIDTKPVMSALKKFRQAFTNPKFEGTLKQIDDFEALVTKHKGDQKALEAILKTKIGDPTAMKNEIYKELLGDFFTANGVRNPNGFESFRSLFSNKQATGVKESGKLDKLIDLAKGQDPIILDGMRAAFMDHIRKELFSVTNLAKDVNPQRAYDFLTKEGDTLRAIGNKLFKEGSDKDVWQAFQVVMIPALDAARAKKSAALTLDTVSGAAKDARSSVSQMVRFIYGPLNRTGTTLNAFTQGMLEYVRPEEYALKLADAMFADPKGFLEALKRSEKGWEKRNGREMRDLVNWAIKSNVYDESQKNKFIEKLRENGEEDQIEELFPSERKGNSFLDKGRKLLEDNIPR